MGSVAHNRFLCSTTPFLYGLYRYRLGVWIAC